MTPEQRNALAGVEQKYYENLCIRQMGNDTFFVVMKSGKRHDYIGSSHGTYDEAFAELVFLAKSEKRDAEEDAEGEFEYAYPSFAKVPVRDPGPRSNQRSPFDVEIAFILIGVVLAFATLCLALPGVPT